MSSPNEEESDNNLVDSSTLRARLKSAKDLSKPCPNQGLSLPLPNDNSQAPRSLKIQSSHVSSEREIAKQVREREPRYIERDEYLQNERQQTGLLMYACYMAVILIIFNAIARYFGSEDPLYQPYRISEVNMDTIKPNSPPLFDSIHGSGRYIPGRYSNPIQDRLDYTYDTAISRLVQHKRWQFFTIDSHDFVVSFAVADLGYAANSFIYYIDKRSLSTDRNSTHIFYDRSIITPFGLQLQSFSESSVLGCTELNNGTDFHVKMCGKPANTSSGIENTANMTESLNNLDSDMDILSKYKPGSWEVYINVVVEKAETVILHENDIINPVDGAYVANPKKYQLVLNATAEQPRNNESFAMIFPFESHTMPFVAFYSDDLLQYTREICKISSEIIKTDINEEINRNKASEMGEADNINQDIAMKISMYFQLGKPLSSQSGKDTLILCPTPKNSIERIRAKIFEDAKMTEEKQEEINQTTLFGKNTHLHSTHNTNDTTRTMSKPPSQEHILQSIQKYTTSFKFILSILQKSRSKSASKSASKSRSSDYQDIEKKTLSIISDHISTMVHLFSRGDGYSSTLSQNSESKPSQLPVLSVSTEPSAPSSFLMSSQDGIQQGYIHKALGMPVQGTYSLTRLENDLTLLHPIVFAGLSSLDWTYASSRRVTCWKWVSFMQNMIRSDTHPNTSSLSSQSSSQPSLLPLSGVYVNLSDDVYVSQEGYNMENILWLRWNTSKIEESNATGPGPATTTMMIPLDMNIEFNVPTIPDLLRNLPRYNKLHQDLLQAASSDKTLFSVEEMRAKKDEFANIEKMLTWDVRSVDSNNAPLPSFSTNTNLDAEYFGLKADIPITNKYLYSIMKQRFNLTDADIHVVAEPISPAPNNIVIINNISYQCNTASHSVHSSLDLKFTLLGYRYENVNLLLVDTQFVQPHGLFDGVIAVLQKCVLRSKQTEKIAESLTSTYMYSEVLIENTYGVMENHYGKW